MIPEEKITTQECVMVLSNLSDFKLLQENFKISNCKEVKISIVSDNFTSNQVYGYTHFLVLDLSDIKSVNPVIKITFILDNIVVKRPILQLSGKDYYDKDLNKWIKQMNDYTNNQVNLSSLLEKIVEILRGTNCFNFANMMNYDIVKRYTPNEDIFYQAYEKAMT